MSDAAQAWLSASDNDRHCRKAFDAATSLPLVHTGARSMQAAIWSRYVRSVVVHTSHVAVHALRLKFGEIVKVPGQLGRPPKKRVWAPSNRLQKAVPFAEPPPVPEVPPPPVPEFPPPVPDVPPPVPEVPPPVTAVPPAEAPPPVLAVPPAVPAAPPALAPPPVPDVPPPEPLMFCMQAPATHEAVTPHAEQAVPFEPHAEAELPV